MVSKISAGNTSAATGSIPETGRSQNAASFKYLLLLFVGDFGPVYQPSSEHLQLWLLQRTEELADIAMTSWSKHIPGPGANGLASK